MSDIVKIAPDERIITITDGDNVLEITEDTQEIQIATVGLIGGTGPNPSNDETEESFYVSVSDAGNDPDFPMRISNQDESDEWGAFATIPGAIDALPTVLKHVVTIKIQDGSWLDGGLGLGDLVRFNFEITDQSESGFKNAGVLKFTSENGIGISPGTVAMDVSGSVDNQVTLQADPGLAQDSFSGQYLVVTSGTGSGQIRPIRSHNGAVFVTAGEFSTVLDATSIVEIQIPKTSITFEQSATQLTTKQTAIAIPCIEFSNIGIASTESDPSLYLTGGTYLFGVGCISSVSVFASYANALIDGCIIDVGANAPCVSLQSSILRVITGTSKPAMLRSLYSYAVVVLGQTGAAGGIAGTSTFFLLGRQYIESSSACVKVQYTGASVRVEGSSGAYLENSGSEDFVFEVLDAADLSIQNLFDLNAMGTNGLLGDVLLDEQKTNWADLDAYSTKSEIGDRFARVFGG